MSDYQYPVSEEFKKVIKKITGNAPSNLSTNFAGEPGRPLHPIQGKVYYNTVVSRFEYHNGSAWQIMSFAAVPILTVPASITPTAGDGQISVAFASVSNATNYVVEVSSNNFATIAATNTGSASPIVITGLTNGTVYKSRVKAIANGYITSGWRTSASTVTPAP